MNFDFFSNENDPEFAERKRQSLERIHSPGYVPPNDEDERAKAAIEDGLRNWRKENAELIIESSSIPIRYRDFNFADFEIYDEKQNIAVNKILDFIGEAADAYDRARWDDNRFSSLPCRGIYLYGEVGTGKTTLASCCTMFFAERVVPVKFKTFGSIIDEYLSATKDSFEKSKAQIITELKDIPILILDDLGQQSFSKTGVESLFKIINERLNADGITIITSNLSPAALEKALKPKGEHYQVEAIISRLYELEKIYLPGVDFRKKRSESR